MKRFALASALALLALSFGGVARAQSTLKIATLAPEGSAWMVSFHEWAKNVEEHTGGKYLMPKVMYARFYAVITQDRPLFEKTLKEVIAAPHDLWPEQRLPNELAKKRAQRYLAHAEDYF